MAANHLNVISIAGSTPISTSAYSQLVAATPIPTNTIVIANGTDQNVTLAVGAAGSEVDLVCVGSKQTVPVVLGMNQVPVGARLAVLAAGAATTNGTFTVSLLP